MPVTPKINKSINCVKFNENNDIFDNNKNNYGFQKEDNDKNEENIIYNLHKKTNFCSF